MLVGADDGAIDKVEQPIELAVRIRLLLEGVEELLPDIRSLPAIEAAGHGWPGPVPLRQVPPGRPGAEDPQDAVDNRAMVMGRSPNLWFVRWEQGFKPLPLRAGQISSAHSTQYYRELSRVCKHALVSLVVAALADGTKRVVNVLITDGMPAIGVQFMEGYTLTMNFSRYMIELSKTH